MNPRPGFCGQAEAAIGLAQGSVLSAPAPETGELNFVDTSIGGSVSTGRTFLRADSFGSIESDSYSDPSAGSFGLAGVGHSAHLWRRAGATLLGFHFSEAQLTGSVKLIQGQTNQTTLDSRIDATQRSFGIYGGHILTDGDSSSRITAGITRQRLDYTVYDDVNVFLLGFPFPGGSLTTYDVEMTALRLGLFKEFLLADGWMLSFGKDYQLSVSSDYRGTRQSSLSVGMSKRLGVSEELRVKRPLESQSQCRGLELVGYDGFSNLSGGGADSDGRRSYNTSNEFGTLNNGAGIRYRFGNGTSGCHAVGIARHTRAINYRVRNPAPARLIDTKVSGDVSGTSYRYAYQVPTIQLASFGSYFSVGLGLWSAGGTLTSSAQYLFDDVSSATSDKLNLDLIDASLGLGFRNYFHSDGYVFLETQISRFDARPFDRDIRGWEQSTFFGIGFDL